MTRYTVVAGRFTLTDFFDNNRYTHDPRTQFMGWAVMYNGAWDYPADTRGYTWGWVHEFHTRNWSLRYASAAEPKVANGLRFDRRLFRDRGDVFEGELPLQPRSHHGRGAAAELSQPHRFRQLREGAAARRRDEHRARCHGDAQAGTLKYGFGINMEQEITKDCRRLRAPRLERRQDRGFRLHRHRPARDRRSLRLRARAGNAPKTPWRPNSRRADYPAVHALYLSRGGLDFLIGDGRLNYMPEYIWESYYSARVVEGFLRNARRAAHRESRPTTTTAGRSGPTRCAFTSKYGKK